MPDDAKKVVVVLSDQAQAQVDADPDKAEALKMVVADIQKATDAINEGKYMSFDEAMEAITGERPVKVDHTLPAYLIEVMEHFVADPPNSEFQFGFLAACLDTAQYVDLEQHPAYIAAHALMPDTDEDDEPTGKDDTGDLN